LGIVVVIIITIEEEEEARGRVRYGPHSPWFRRPLLTRCGLVAERRDILMRNAPSQGRLPEAHE